MIRLGTWIDLMLSQCSTSHCTGAHLSDCATLSPYTSRACFSYSGEGCGLSVQSRFDVQARVTRAHCFLSEQVTTYMPLPLQVREYYALFHRCTKPVKYANSTVLSYYSTNPAPFSRLSQDRDSLRDKEVTSMCFRPTKDL